MNKKEIDEFPKVVAEFEKELSKVIVGQTEVLKSIICAILCDGHVLLEGVPGIAKTLIMRTIASVMGCDIKRVQFTVDLLPTDIVGSTLYTPSRGFEVVKGPIFSNFLLSDEINRAPPKTQSALLEAMQEKNVTIGKKTFVLPKPFFVMATENPLEVSGVYTLPEAQVDRFLFKVTMTYPNEHEEKSILTQNISLSRFEDYKIKRLLSPGKIIHLQEETKKIFSSDKVKKYIVEIVRKTRDKNFKFSKYISFGASPRASISLFIASKAEALMNGRDFVLPEDVRKVAHLVLRHRIILNYEAEADKISSDDIIKELLEELKAE